MENREFIMTLRCETELRISHTNEKQQLVPILPLINLFLVERRRQDRPIDHSHFYETLSILKDTIDSKSSANDDVQMHSNVIRNAKNI